MARKHHRRAAVLSAAIAVWLIVPMAVGYAGRRGGGQVQLQTTVDDFFQPGTQPAEPGFEPIVASGACSFCHSNYLPEQDDYREPGDAWVNSMMAQSARDPVWHAALTIANQDAVDAGEYCIRCHAPGAWLAGRSLPADTSGFIEFGTVNDFDGVTCHFCHRNVNPVFEVDSPEEDFDILADLEFPPGPDRGNGRFVVDPADVRRGPFDDVPQNLHGVPIIPSPFHRKSSLCGACHDVANPVFTRQEDGSYAINPLGVPHETQQPNDMFPEQRTYSEWLNSSFANGGVFLPDGRFGGNHPTGIMQECQDCHMPDAFTGGCFAWEFEPFFARPDMPQHTFAGANHWVLNAVRALYDDGDTGLSEDSIAAAQDRTAAMLRAASDVEVQQVGPEIRVRVINESGHKLPTGYPEGRRMWLNVQFFDDTETLVEERGAYDLATAELTESDTTVFQMESGIGQDVADATGMPVGKSFHLVLVNEVLSDNRIPPRGFTNEAFDTFGGAPVGAVYADGQHWHDTVFTIPQDATRVAVTLYYQSMTKDYIEFLRDANVTNDTGQVIHDLWEDPLVGAKAMPIDMDMVDLDLIISVAGDITGDGFVDFSDLLQVLSTWGPCPPPSLCSTDLDGSGTIDFADLLIVLSNWG